MNVFCNCANAILMITKENHGYHHYSDIIEATRKLVSRNWEVRFYFFYREEN